MTLVPSCVLVSLHSYGPSPSAGTPTTIDIHADNVPDGIVPVVVLIVVDTTVQMKEETSLVSTIDGVNTGIFATNTAEQTVLVNDVLTLVTQMKNQAPVTNRQH